MSGVVYIDNIWNMYVCGVWSVCGVSVWHGVCAVWSVCDVVCLGACCTKAIVNSFTLRCT